MAPRKTIRPLGDVMLSLETILEEMSYEHDLQWGEIMALCHCWLVIHAPSQQEVYDDGSHPVYKYGPEHE